MNEPLQAHMNTHACLEAQEMRDMNFFFWGTQHLLKCCTHFFFFLGHYVVHLLSLEYVAMYASFYGVYVLKIMG
jgi:hypothetical protein